MAPVLTFLRPVSETFSRPRKLDLRGWVGGHLRELSPYWVKNLPH